MTNTVKLQLVFTMKTLRVLVLVGIALTVNGEAQRFGSCYTDKECPGKAVCALWAGCFMGTCVCSKDPSDAFGCLWKKAGDSCALDSSTNECTGPPSQCKDGKCSCPVNRYPARHSNYWCDDQMKAGRNCDENTVLIRGESCEEGKVVCRGNFREDPHTGKCRPGMPGEECSKNEECGSVNCNSSVCVCGEGMVPSSEIIRYYAGNGYNISTVTKCKPENAPLSSIPAGGNCGGYLTCKGSTCMECPEGGVNVCVDLTKVGSITSKAPHSLPHVILLLTCMAMFSRFLLL